MNRSHYNILQLKVQGRGGGNFFEGWMTQTNNNANAGPLELAPSHTRYKHKHDNDDNDRGVGMYRRSIVLNPTNLLLLLPKTTTIAMPQTKITACGFHSERFFH